jgi:hypothetical protein
VSLTLNSLRNTLKSVKKTITSVKTTLINVMGVKKTLNSVKITHTFECYVFSSQRSIVITKSRVRAPVRGNKKLLLTYKSKAAASTENPKTVAQIFLSRSCVFFLHSRL